MKLHIATGLSLPDEAVTQTFAILAMRGVGKTHTASVMAEEFCKASLPFRVIEPTGAWWGLRASADGKSEGYPVTILGGDHGDAPLEETSGKLIANLSPEEAPFLVLDLSLLSKSAMRRFVADYAEELYRRNRVPMHVIFDEGDAFAPQRPRPDELRMLGAIDEIVRRGRIRGLGCTLVTQRSAVLNKDVLTQTEVLIALRTAHPRDRAPVLEWMKVHATAAQLQEVEATLAGLPKGDAWVMSAGWLELFRRVHIRERETFNSSATPQPGVRRIEPKKLAAVDLVRLQDRMKETIERAKANDPAALRRRVAELERDLARKPAAAVSAPVKERRVEVPVVKDAQVKRLEVWIERVATLQDRLAQAQQVVVTEVGNLRTALAQARGRPPPAAPRPPAPVPLARRATPAPPTATAGRNGVQEQLDKPKRAALAVLAQHHEGCSAAKLALLSGYRWSGGFRNALSTLRSGGLIEGRNTGTMRITDAGRAALGDGYNPLPTGRALLDYWLNHPSFGACERAVLRALEEHREGLAAEQLAGAADYEWSGGFRNALSNLRTAGVLVGRNSEVMRLTETLL